MDSEKQQIIAIPLEEYKELLIIKGKYEEYQHSKLVIWDGRKEDGATIIPQKEIHTIDPKKLLKNLERNSNFESTL